MPIYEYVCRDCSQSFELLVRNDTEAACPACGGRQLSKQWSVPAAHTSEGKQQACPLREPGSCGMSQCCGQSCELGWDPD
jgi:putative FmdB family regulatory protein